MQGRIDSVKYAIPIIPTKMERTMATVLLTMVKNITRPMRNKDTER